MIDPRLAWFAMGALCGAVLFGWPWHPRFSRYSRRGSNPPPPYSSAPPPPLPPPPPYSSAAMWSALAGALRDEDAQRDAKFIDPSLGVPWDEGHTQRGNGSGGPTTPKPPIKPRFPPPRTIREDLL